MRRATLALLTLLVLAAPSAAGAAQGGILAEADGVRAQLTYDEDADGFRFRDLRLTVTRQEVAAHDAPVTFPERVARCDEFCRPVNLRVRDVDADGEPEVVLQVFTGGAHCCSALYLLRRDATSGAYTVITRDFADPGFRLTADGLFVTGDVRFNYEFAAYAGSRAPVQLLRLRAGRFTDVTRAEGRARMAKESRALWREWRGFARRSGRDARFAQGILAAWAGDEARLGRGAAALRRVRREAARGFTTPGFPRLLARRLRSWGYVR